MDIILRGGQIIDPFQGIDSVADILISGGRVAGYGLNMSRAGAEVIDVTGKAVVPGLIDMHAHLREPGFEYKEDIRTGTRAAARGGFTAVACMPNTQPVLDSGLLIAALRDKAVRTGLVRVYPIGAVTKGLRGGEMAELGGMRREGAVAFSDDGMPVLSAALMRCVLEYAAMLGVPVIDHCEEKSLVGDVGINAGRVAVLLGLRGMPAAAEDTMVARDCLLAGMTGGHVHIAHLSTAGAVEIVRQAKARGIRVTAEACPHHFTLTEEAVNDYDTNAKVNPPLRTAADVAAVRAGLRDGTIDVIATDHAPHAADEKEAEFSLAPAGISGLETAVPLVLTELVETGVLSMAEAIYKMTAAPARILGLAGGSLRVGAAADITVIDRAAAETVDPAAFASKGRNTPFAGRAVRGLPFLTMVGGRIVMRDRQLIAE
ncbi:MAG: dihydroorotase [bacterium]|jgi:dihydroorotase